jgi:16S rRNA (cytosine1402-N4)-methyltransferase
VKRFLAARAQGCTCPPGLPVCVCGRTPGAELIGRGIAPSAGEIASNPRSTSARMRAARKLREEDQEPS